MNIAICPSSHGFGHTSRQLAVGKLLIQQGYSVHFFSHIPKFVRHYLPEATVHECFFDVGLAQPNPVEIDIHKTLELLTERCSSAKINTIATALKKFDLVIADIPPTVLEACRRNNIPCLAISNFDWAWIYRHFEELLPWANTFASWQQPHTALHITPGPTLCHFSKVITIPPLAREYQPFHFPQKRILLAFGGFESEELISSLPEIPDIFYLVAPPNIPSNRKDIEYCDTVSYPQLISGCWAILGKPGYGLITEAAQAGTPLILIPRDIFPESEYLRQFSEQNSQIWLQNSPSDNGFTDEFIQAIQHIQKKGPSVPSSFQGAREIVKLLRRFSESNFSSLRQ